MPRQETIRDSALLENNTNRLYFFFNMTPREVFLWYFRMHRALYYFSKAFYKYSPTKWSDSCNYYEKMTFDEHLNKIAYDYGMLAMPKILLETLPNYDDIIQKDKNLNKALRNWRYFVTHNLILDECNLKEGDGVWLTWSARTHEEGARPTNRITRIDPCKMFVNVSVPWSSSPKGYQVSLNDIENEKGEKPYFSFYIKRGKKVYGKKEARRT